ncbi:hypothetical protein AO716_03280 [Arthrobacter sp. Edens01]|nr:hypothetical protein AO716_03280 [Arthrobacter sp. Edens01]
MRQYEGKAELSKADEFVCSQRAIAEWLEEQRPELGHTYRGARELLNATPDPGQERTRVLLICHSMREVINRLPTAVMLGRGSIYHSAEANHKTSSELVRGLPSFRVDYPEMDLSLEVENVPVPHGVAVALNRLIDAAVHENQRRLSDIATFLTDDANPKHPAVRDWRGLSEYFTRWAHLSDKPEQSIPTDQQLAAKIRIFEEHVDAIRLAFFESKSVVEGLLAAANALIEEGQYSVPARIDVEAAARRLTSYQLRRLFYEGLKNPHWVKPLADLGVFIDPPEPEPVGDGNIRDVFWPEVSYLTNVCTEVPGDVVDILLSLEASSNSWVRRAAFVIGSQVPAVEAVRLKPLLKVWAKSGGFGWRTDPRDMVAFAINLLTGGQTKYGVSFANLLFRPRETPGDGRNSVVELENYWYVEEMPRLLEALGDTALKTVLPWLVENERIKKTVTDDFDHSGFARSSVGQQLNERHDIGDTLIDAVRACAITGFGSDAASTWSLFSRKPILITERIAMHSLAQVLGSLSDSEAPLLVEIGKELLCRPKCRDEGALLEFVALARALAQRCEREALERIVAQGHFTDEDRDRIRRNMAASGEPLNEIESSIERWEDHWQHRVLSGIGRELLSDGLVSELDRLETMHGVLEDPLRPSFQLTSWEGPNSPVEQAEMAAMSPSELVAQLESWHMTDERFGPSPSHEGQSRVLVAVLTANPRALGEVTGLVRRLRPTYIRAAFSGWEAAFKAGLDLDWVVVIDALADAVKHGRESSFPAEGRQYDDDADFTSAKKAAVGLLEELSKPKNAETIGSEWLVPVADLIVEVSGDEAAWTDYARSDASSSAMDPLTVSLNWQWPILIRALVNLVAHGSEAQWHEVAESVLRRELARDDPRGASHAVLGEGLGRLHDGASEWLRENLALYFGSAGVLTRHQQIALTTAIAMYHYHPALYRLLSGSMIAALQEHDIAVGWGDPGNPKGRIGQWVVQAIIRGHISDDDELRQAFYQIAAPEVRGDAIGHIAWSFMHADVVDASIRDRLGSLWDERVRHVEFHPAHNAELKDFYWFVRCGKFSASWWLPRLTQAVQRYPELSTHGMIGGQLAKAASTMPADALAALTALLKPEDTESLNNWDLRREALAPVIASALESGDPQLGQEAMDLMNAMGARGEIDLDRRVAELREKPGG